MARHREQIHSGEAVIHLLQSLNRPLSLRAGDLLGVLIDVTLRDCVAGVSRVAGSCGLLIKALINDAHVFLERLGGRDRSR